ncbi:MAG: response regulator, partial [Myxococcales bacterium]|nr:response regulator [Myxococcales bacterium]
MAGERILVIDDSPTITKVVQLVLTKSGFQVDTAPDGEAGLAAARATRPDVILLDFMMPKMNGYQLCRELVADAELRDIPVVLMSAKGDQVGERFVKTMGIVDYITKPFSPDAVTGVVRHVLDKYRQTDNLEDAAARVTRDDVLDGKDLDRAEVRRTVLAQLRASLVDALTSDAAGHDLRDPLRRAADAALGDVALTRMLAPLDLDALREPASGLRGDLHVVPLAGLLQLLDAQEQSGVLAVERGAARVEVHVRRGRIDQAIAHRVADELKLGR